jgi:hypothetical protein
VRAHETAAPVVGPGKKMTGQGPHVSEGGEGKAGWAGRRPLGRLASGPTRGRGEVGHGWPKGRMGRLAAGPIGPKVKEKFFSE